MEKTICENITYRMKTSIDKFKKYVNGLRSQNISSNILDNVKIEYYGNIIPITKISNIIVENKSTLKINVFDVSMIKKIEKAILLSNLGIHPVISKNNIRISIPLFTEENRKNLIIQIRKESENIKISIRNIRREINNSIKNKNITEDNEYLLQNKIQKITNIYIKEIDKIVNKKINKLKKI